MTSEYVTIGPRPWEAKIFLDHDHSEEIAEIKERIRRASNLLEKMMAISGLLLRRCMTSFVLFQSLY
jgi:hypothetical protein